MVMPMEVMDSFTSTSTVPCEVHHYYYDTDDSHHQLRQRLTCRLLDMIRQANKMSPAVPIENSSQLAVEPNQSAMVQTNPSNLQTPGGPFPRRYSKAQDEEAEDTFDTEHILNRFSTTMALHQYSRLRGHNLYEPSGSSDDEWSSLTNSSFVEKSITKCLSASDLSKQTGSDSHTSNPPEQHTGFISRLIQRRGSTGNVLSRVPPEALGLEGKPQTSSDDSALVLASQRAVAQVGAVSKDITDPAGLSGVEGASSGFGLLSRTRQFGAWLTKATEGEKVDVTRTDLNVVAPSSF